jgi:methionyl-tRNA formyltransferase
LAELRVLLFGMTGLGNGVLRGLLDIPSVRVTGVVCPRPEPGPFPHYPCRKIEDEASERGVPVLPGVDLSDPTQTARLADLGADLLVVGSFRKILPAAVIALPGLGAINVHPSLLPRYRGATPTVWAILNGETETGVTVHFIEDERLDAGPVIVQRRIALTSEDTDGSLRRRLAELARALVPEAVAAVVARPRKDFSPQDESKSSWFPKRTLADAQLDPSRPLPELRRRIRAMSPWPGARLRQEEREYIVTEVNEVNTSEPHPQGLQGTSVLRLRNGSRTLSFMTAHEA